MTRRLKTNIVKLSQRIDSNKTRLEEIENRNDEIPVKVDNAVNHYYVSRF